MSDVQYVLYGSDGLGVSVDAWRNDFKEYIEEMELDIEPENEIEFYQYILKRALMTQKTGENSEKLNLPTILS